MERQALDNGVSALNFARRVTLGLLEDLPDDKLLHRSLPDGNHALWLIGHILWDDDFFLTGLAHRPSKLPDGWNERFRTGSTPCDDVQAYPPRGALMDKITALRSELVGWFCSFGPHELAQPLPEAFARFGDSYGKLMSTLAWHEGLHAGQLTVIRKSLNLRPRFG